MIGPSSDEHCDRVEAGLGERNAHVARLSLSDLPEAGFSWSESGHLKVAEHQLQPEALSGLWRRTGAPQVQDFDELFSDFVNWECEDAFRGGLEALGVQWITDPRSLRRAELKLVQLRAAKRLGLPVPSTLVTNDSHEAVAFAEAIPDLVAKPVRYGLVSSEPIPMVALTSLVDAGMLQHLSGSPVVLQQRIRARQHLRVVTVGPRTFIAGLESEDLDWRANLENHAGFRVRNDDGLEGLADGARRLCEELTLGFSSQDWIIDAEGKPWFLEANPNGQWLLMDDIQDGEITDSLVDHLMEVGP